MAQNVRKERIDIPGYFQGISERLELQVKQLTPVIVHSVEMGDNDHQWFAELLRQYLPKRFAVDTGFVINSESDKGSADFFTTTTKPRTQDESIGPQSDILLLDVFNNAPLCTEKTFSVCPVEMVLGVIEVTRDLDADKLETDLKKLARVRKLGAVKKYAEQYHSSAHRRRPLAYLVGLQSSLSEDAIVKHLSDIDDDLRPNGILLLDKAFYVRKRYEVDLLRIEKDRLFHFISTLRHQIETFPQGRTNLREYLGPEADVIWGPPGGLSSSSASAGDYADFDEQSG